MQRINRRQAPMRKHCIFWFCIFWFCIYFTIWRIKKPVIVIWIQSSSTISLFRFFYKFIFYPWRRISSYNNFVYICIYIYIYTVGAKSLHTPGRKKVFLKFSSSFLAQAVFISNQIRETICLLNVHGWYFIYDTQLYI